ncbi:PhzF family phenazine biosynthesis protein, partial [Pseudomonas sp.]|uniref:PhzF family phenazine biosynthesis protein n=1 Tax=Pseudomonas sp. TaxID=306 RepID=UPI003CC693CC
MQLNIYQVDAFANRPFGGNPAAVCPLTEWLPDARLQAIAEENNLSETAYFVRTGDAFELRWFTPTVEVDLCGHATLAAAWVIANELPDAPEVIRFATRSGELRVTRTEHGLAMDFPAKAPEPSEPPAGLLDALGIDKAEVFATDD